jgi:hypothetical protein
MNRMIWPSFFGQVVEHGLQRSSNSPRNFAPAISAPMSSEKHALAAQAFGHFVVDDALREAFDDGGLAHAGLADQHRVVLRAALQDLHAAADFLVAPITGSSLPLSARAVRSMVYFSSAWRWSSAFSLCTFSPPRMASMAASSFCFVRAGGLQRAAGLAAVVERGEQEQLAGDERIALCPARACR